MKKEVKGILFIFCLLFLGLGRAEAKHIVVPKMYMFGFAASFNDTIVHFTDVMEVDSVWIDSKRKFLLGRNVYSHQFKEYLTTHEQMPARTCVTIFATKRSKAEKKLLKMRRLYGPTKKGQTHFDVRYIDSGAFKFKTVNMNEFTNSEENASNSSQRASKEKKKDKKRGK